MSSDDLELDERGAPKMIDSADGILRALKGRLEPSSERPYFGPPMVADAADVPSFMEAIKTGMLSNFAARTFPAIQYPAEDQVMPFEAARAFLSTIKLGPFPFLLQRYEARLEPSEFASQPLPSGMYVLLQTLTAKLMDRNDPNVPIDLTFTDRANVLAPVLLTKRHLTMLVRGFLRLIALHELDEQILVAGERVFDPHRGGRTEL